LILYQEGCCGYDEIELEQLGTRPGVEGSFTMFFVEPNVLPKGFSMMDDTVVVGTMSGNCFQKV
jgi:hypothetical protein